MSPIHLEHPVCNGCSHVYVILSKFSFMKAFLIGSFFLSKLPSFNFFLQHYKKSSDGKPKRRQISRPISKINKRPRPSSDLPLERPPYQYENPAISDNESHYEVGASEVNRHDGHHDDNR